MREFRISEAQLDELRSFLGTWEDEIEHLRRADEIVAQVKAQPLVSAQAQADCEAVAEIVEIISGARPVPEQPAQPPAAE